jgi:hypothetical protein
MLISPVPHNFEELETFLVVFSCTIADNPAFEIILTSLRRILKMVCLLT